MDRRIPGRDSSRTNNPYSSRGGASSARTSADVRRNRAGSSARAGQGSSARNEYRSRMPRNAGGGAQNPRSGSGGGNIVDSLMHGFDANGFSGRATVILALFFAVLLVIAGRLVWLQIIDSQNIQNTGTSREVTVQMEARRGTIYDRNGTILATTVDAYNVFCHPHVVDNDEVNKLAEALTEVFGDDVADIVASADEEETQADTQDSSDTSATDGTDSSDAAANTASTKATTKEIKAYFKEKITTDTNFVYLFKGADEEQMEKIKDLEIEGVDFEETSKRVYPCGSTASQIIGVLNSDGEALTGLELYYDDILGGTDGEKTTEYSKEGVPIPGATQVTAEVVNGKDIVITIDIEMQQKLEESLALRVEAVGGSGGSAIMMDSDSGEIYACSSSPTFDITDLSEMEDGATNLSGISSSYEPGSIFKSVTMLAALEEGVVTPDKEYNCPEVLTVDDYSISDAHARPAQEMTATKILADSSNVGISLIAKDLTFKKFAKYIKRYQVTDTTGVDYPGEASGYIADLKDWTDVQGYNISFGQGVATTPIAMTRFYGALANGGVACTPHFLLDVPTEEEDRTWETATITENTDALEDLEGMLEEVVNSGTATAGAIDGFRVAGKTGTAEIASEEGGYKKGIYNLSFVGFLPDTSTNFVCFVGATEVPGDRQTVQAFRDIMTFAIDRYEITQD